MSRNFLRDIQSECVGFWFGVILFGGLALACIVAGFDMFSLHPMSHGKPCEFVGEVYTYRTPISEYKNLDVDTEILDIYRDKQVSGSFKVADIRNSQDGSWIYESKDERGMLWLDTVTVFQSGERIAVEGDWISYEGTFNNLYKDGVVVRATKIENINNTFAVFPSFLKYWIGIYLLVYIIHIMICLSNKIIRQNLLRFWFIFIPVLGNMWSISRIDDMTDDDLREYLKKNKQGSAKQYRSLERLHDDIFEPARRSWDDPTVKINHYFRKYHLIQLQELENEYPEIDSIIASCYETLKTIYIDSDIIGQTNELQDGVETMIKKYYDLCMSMYQEFEAIKKANKDEIIAKQSEVFMSGVNDVTNIMQELHNEARRQSAERKASS